MSLFDIYKAIKVGRSDSLFASLAGNKLNKDAWKKGFNKWDEEWEVGSISSSTGADTTASDRIRSKNYIPCNPDTFYYWNFPADTGVLIVYYDEDKSIVKTGSGWWNVRAAWETPSAAHYMRFTTNAAYGTSYNNNICINISGEHNGEYVPYNG